jgi:hypothetical protein
MGLSIHWEWSFQGDAATARRVVEAVRAGALSAGFTEVGEVVEAWAERHETAEDVIVARAWAMGQGLRTQEAVVDGHRNTTRIAPLHVAAFRAYSRGAEEAAFGLASYTGLDGYRWSAGCDTQGAAKRGSPTGFLAAHRAVVATLDKARSLGIKVTAKDDGGYWEHRDIKRLLDKLDEWERLVAGLGKGRANEKPCFLASEMKSRVEAVRKGRKDPKVIEELEG